jgi:hypothetical protein
MESILASTEDHLVSNLAYKLPQNSASYVQDKQQVTYFPQGGDVYSPLGGQRVIRFSLSSSGYLDLSSLVFTMDFQNGPINPCTMLVNGGHALFTRVRVLVSGTEVENLEHHNVVAEMFHRMLPQEKQDNVSLMAFAGGPIAAGAKKQIIFRPAILGICNQEKWIPPFLGHQGIVIEMHCASPDACMQSGADQSQIYSLSNVRALCDVYTLDSALNNVYASHVLASKPLVFPLKSLITTSFQLQPGTPSFDVNVARAISRCNSIFVTLHGEPGALVQDVNTFISGGNPEEIQGRVQIGSKQWPDGQNVTGLSQFWYRLVTGLGVFHSASHTLAITRDQFAASHFVYVTDTEKCPVASGTGYPVNKGELITVSMKNLGATHQRALVTLHHDIIMELRDTGCDVLV